MDHTEKIIRKPNPRDGANIFSVLTFLYTRKFFVKALKKDLEEEDLYEVVKSCNSKKCGDKIEQDFLNDKRKNKLSTGRILWKIYGKRYIFLTLIGLCFQLVSELSNQFTKNYIFEPEAIGKLVVYFKPKQTVLTFKDAFYYAGIMIILKLLHSFYNQNFVIQVLQLSTEIRTALSSLIYRKSLKLTSKALSQISVGHIVTVITKDIPQFEYSIWFFNDIFISGVEVIVFCYLLYNKVGLVSLVGIGMVGFLIACDTCIGLFVKSMRIKMNRKTDERLQTTQESLSAIRVIKMFSWETFFRDKLDKSRTKEVKLIVKTLFLRTLMLLMSCLCSKICFYAVVLTYIWLNNSIRADVLFYVMRCFATLKKATAFSVSTGVVTSAELSASLNRINNVLNAEELDNTKEEPTNNPEINLKNVTVIIKDKIILQNIDLNLTKGLNIITGQLGCGKSYLIKTILEEYSTQEVVVETRGKMSYASQNPWLFPSTIRRNILFGESYDHNRYNEVLKVCALHYDFSLLDKGDDTIVTDRGLNLSKGQQIRINLARAVYRHSDIYLLDDSLTSLDPQVQDYIFNKCIRGFLKDKLVILVTQNFNHLNIADKLIVMTHGKIKIHIRETNFPKNVLNVLENDTLKERDDIEDEDSINESTKLLGINASSDKKGVYHEIKKIGGVSTDVYKRYFKLGGNFLFLSSLVVTFAIGGFSDSYSENLMSYWVNIEQNITAYTEINVNLTEIQKITNISKPVKHVEAPKLLKTLPGNFVSKATMIGSFNNTETSQTFVNIKDLQIKSDKTLKVISLIILSSVIWESLKLYFVLKFTRNISMRIHRSMVDTILYSMMSFFDNHHMGNILNRFVQDLSTIDERLPWVLLTFVGNMVIAGGGIILIVVANWNFLIPALVLFIFLIALRFIYMPASRSLRRLDSATHSPLLGHLNSTMEGLTTIRAYKTQHILIDEFDRHQDLYTSAHFTTFCLRSAFRLYMDISCIIFLSIIVGRYLFFDVDAASGDVGLAITKAVIIPVSIKTLLLMWAEFENTMTSVERVLEYTTLEKETNSGVEISQWPNNAEITYTIVSLTYPNTNEKVLRNINFVALPGQKIGIVGRTGAGKSSIISALFRLYNYEGQILIDGVDIKTLSLNFLRKHISIIPQDPVLFTGTVRNNIDPLQKYTDEEIWRTLHKLQLFHIIPSLNFEITDTSNFSSGQRQLICLTRAMIRKTKIVILDEATPDMDSDTNVLIQNSIFKNFSNCTVIIITHKLQLILDCDQVIVMEKGIIVEYDNTEALIEKKNGVFVKMLQNAGLLS